MSAPSEIDTNRLAQLNARLYELRHQPSITIRCHYNDPRVNQMGDVIVPETWWQAHQHLFIQIAVGVHMTQGQYCFVKFQRGEEFVHRMVARYYLGKEALHSGYQIHHRNNNVRDQSLKNLMIVTAQMNSSARGPSNAINKSLPGVKGVQQRRNRYIVEFQCGDRSYVPKITATLPLSEKTLALALYNMISRHFNQLAFQNAHDPLTQKQRSRLQELFDACMVRYRKRQTVFEANGGRPTKRTRS